MGNVNEGNSVPEGCTDQSTELGVRIPARGGGGEDWLLQLAKAHTHHFPSDMGFSFLKFDFNF